MGGRTKNLRPWNWFLVPCLLVLRVGAALRVGCRKGRGAVGLRRPVSNDGFRDARLPGYAPLLRIGFPPEARCGERRGRTRGKWLAKASLLFIRSERNSWKMSHALTILGSTSE